MGCILPFTVVNDSELSDIIERRDDRHRESGDEVSADDTEKSLGEGRKDGTGSKEE